MKKYLTVLQWILQSIQDRTLLPGDKLPSESELCEQFSVSRNSVRSALRELAEEGVLESRKGIGTFFIRPPGRQPETATIGFVCFFTGSYIFPEIIKGCDQILYKNGFHILLNQSEYDVEKERNILLNLKKREVDGIIIEPVFSGEGKSNCDVLLDIQASGIPVVLIDNFFPEKNFTSVVMDDPSSGRTAAEYLWKMGHRKIGMFFQDDYLPKKRRASGFADAIRRLGKEVPEKWIAGFQGQGPGSNIKEKAADFMRRRDLPTALFCSSDHDALQFIQEAEAQGFQVPGDISIIGFDNSEIARLEKISLTSIEHPSWYIGQISAKLLLDRIFYPEIEVRTETVIAPRLVTRNSVRKLKGND